MSRASYVLIARVLHWVLAVGLIAETLLGLYGDRLPYASGGDAARATFIYALHKTIGVGLLALALVFALWLHLAPRRARGPGPVGWDVAAGRLVYWGLFAGMLAMPLTGPLLHGNGPSWGFAPILWPFAPEVPGVPRAFAAHAAVSAFHVATWWLFTLLSVVHVLLWARRVDARRRPEARPAGLTLGPWLLRLSPLGGVLMWAALAAATWPG